MDKFFTLLVKALAAAGSAAIVIFAKALIGLFTGAQPSDVSAFVWTLVGTVGVLVVNFLVAKFGPSPVTIAKLR